MDKNSLGSDIGLSVLNSAIILLASSVLLSEVALKPFIQHFLPQKRFSMHRGFILTFSCFAILYSVFELASEAMNIVSSRRNYVLDNHRSFFAVQRSINGFMATCLIAMCVLLFYYTSLTALRAKVYMFGSVMNEETLSRWIGIKGVLVILTSVVCLLILCVNTAQVIIIAKKDRITDAVLSIQIVLCLLFYVPVLLVMSAAITCSYNVLRAKSKNRDGINSYGDDVEEQQDEETIRARQHSFAYMVISTLLMFRMGLSMLHELMFLLNYSGAVHETAGLIVSDWLDSIVHFACIAFFVLSYYSPLTPYDKKAPLSTSVATHEYDNRSSNEASTLEPNFYQQQL